MNSTNQKVLVSEAEREAMAKRSVFVGTKLQTRVVDLTGEATRLVNERKKAGLSMYIEIQPFKPDRYKEPNTGLSFSKDAKHGVYYGIVAGFHEDGNVKWRRLMFREHESLNLDNDSDAQLWVILRMHPSLHLSPFALSDPKYKVYDAEEDATGKISKASEASLALDRVTVLKGAELVSFARLIGLHMSDGISLNIIRGMVNDFAYSKPHNFNKLFDSSDRNIDEIIASSFELGLLNQIPDRGYDFDGFPLGLNKEQVKRTLKENNDILLKLSRQIKQEDTLAKQVSDEEKALNKKPRKRIDPEEKDNQGNNDDNNIPFDNGGNSNILD